jgi:steroid 5-alpha reductase family enzyme
MIALILTGTFAVCGLMLVLWIIHIPMRNAAIVDAGWAGGLALLAVIYAVYGGGWETRRFVIAAMALIWGLRLGFYLLLTRVIGHPEEGRYVELRRKWGSNIAFKFLLFFEFQAILDVVLSAPFLLAALNPSPKFSPIEIAGAVIWAVALIGEIAADSQLSNFKTNPTNRGKTCQVGLWHYSRHPNYFFEWLIWVGFALFAASSPYGYVAFLSPAMILFFVLKLTGIPATEAQALRSRGDEYRAYQRTTSAFVPWFPKR